MGNDQLFYLLHCLFLGIACSCLRKLRYLNITAIAAGSFTEQRSRRAPFRSQHGVLPPFSGYLPFHNLLPAGKSRRGASDSLFARYVPLIFWGMISAETRAV